MHIHDGFLSPEVAAGTAVLAAGAVTVGLRRAGSQLDDRVVPLLGVTGAFVFAAQMLNFPVAGGTSGHFLGAALATVLLGPWLACLVLAVVLATQSFMFAVASNERDPVAIGHPSQRLDAISGNGKPGNMIGTNLLEQDLNLCIRIGAPCVNYTASIR